MHSVAILLHVAHQVTEIQYPYASTSRASPAAAPGTGLSPRSTIGTYFFKSFFFYHCLLEVKRSSTGEFVRLFLRHTFVRRYVVAQKNSLSLVHSISSAARLVSSERGKERARAGKDLLSCDDTSTDVTSGPKSLNISAWIASEHSSSAWSLVMFFCYFVSNTATVAKDPEPMVV